MNKHNPLDLFLGFVAGVGMVLALLTYLEAKENNNLTEVQTFIKMTEEQQKQYLAYKENK